MYICTYVLYHMYCTYIYSNHIHNTYILYICTSVQSAYKVSQYIHLVKHQIVQHVVHYLEELESSQEVIDVAPQRLQRRIGLLLPHAGDLTCQHAVSNLLQLRGHQNKTLHQHNMESSTHWSAVHQIVTG